MNFELNPITVNCPKIVGNFFGPIPENLLFGHNEKNLDKMGKF